jgi:hypothetical protein
MAGEQKRNHHVLVILHLRIQKGNTPMCSIFETPHCQSGHGFLVAVQSGRGMKSACYLRDRSGHGFSAAVQRKKW